MDAAISDVVELPLAPVAPAPQEPLTARLFSIRGKMTVTLLTLSADQAVATTHAPPPMGSIAVVTRNSVRLPATVASAEGACFTLTLDEPLDGRRRDRFVGGGTADQVARAAAA